jgi:hypothetical protein
MISDNDSLGHLFPYHTTNGEFLIFSSDAACRGYEPFVGYAKSGQEYKQWVARQKWPLPRIIREDDIAVAIHAELDSIDWEYEEELRQRRQRPQLFVREDAVQTLAEAVRTFRAGGGSAPAPSDTTSASRPTDFAFTCVDGDLRYFSESQVVREFQRLRERIRVGLQSAQVQTYEVDRGGGVVFYVAAVPGGPLCRLLFAHDEALRVRGQEFWFHSARVRDLLCGHIVPPVPPAQTDAEAFAYSVASADGCTISIELPCEGSTVWDAKQKVQAAVPQNEVALQVMFVAGQEEPLADDDCLAECTWLTCGGLFLVMKPPPPRPTGVN